MNCSEDKFKCQLDRPRAPDLVQRIEATALAATAEIIVQHLRRLPELGSIAEVVDWAAKVRVVKEVEEISPRLERYPFRESELSP